VKILYLFRHAKSSWDEPLLSDFDRPLSKRGQKTAPQMGRIMRQRKVSPDLVICSPARRTKETAKLALEKARIDADVVFTEGIYEASVRALLSVLSKQDGSVGSILMIGHNPGMSDLIETLTGQVEEFPTAALARLSLAINHWREIEAGCGKLDWLVRPKDVLEN